MSTQRVAVDEAGRESICWCCARTYPEARLVRLGSHPEVQVCFQCARFLHRRAREQADVLRGDRALAARGRLAVQTCRDYVVRHDWQRGHLAGPVLRWIDRFLP